MSRTASTVYFDPPVKQALKMKAVVSGISFSDLMNQLAVDQLSEDNEDIAAFEERKNGEYMSYESFLELLKKDGTI